ncbi:hypothetical protein DIE11_17310 [Burkholderia sp. Bp9012]|uniref:MASE1 domain-containing protein n=1 Tax=Burkholderia sp. Bp9012 TaxID=2184562 RepID=UPI000F5A8B73|nr:MASE1 domain-containing protein [Burkholderia sp. Bp9012]RQR79156.1 hypothetical protein DIE11_17310 [Burkholderia sp. Bp9012]
MQWKQFATVCARHAAVAMCYAAGFALFRAITLPQWTVQSGFRLLMLLLVPRRYWPALAVGETVPLGYVAYECVDQFGAAWACLAVIPPIVFAMPLVRAFRDHLGLDGSRPSLQTDKLIVLGAAVSVVWMIANVSSLAVTRLPPNYPAIDWNVVVGRWLIGNFLGILSVVPFALFVRETWKSSRPTARLRLIVDSHFFIETVSIVLPALVLLAWLGRGGIGLEARQVARIAMFIPVVMLALRHGWHGAAVGGMLASVAAVTTMSKHFDGETLQAQTFICFAIAAMMVLGARIASLNERDEEDKINTRVALALVQRNVDLGERQLHLTSLAIDQVRESVRSAFTTIFNRVRQALPLVDESGMRRQALAAQEQLYRLADTIYPVVWHVHGLPTALREGATARALSECGVAYWCDVQGASVLSDLSQTLHITLYRLTCEAIGFACSKPSTTDIRLVVRGGRWGGRRWAYLRIEYWENESRASVVRRDELMSRMPFSGFGVDAMRDRAAAFGGRLRIGSLSSRRQSVSVVLHDTDTDITV